MSECPHCGQPMRVKFGIRFTPQQAEILGAIEDAGKARGGIEIESLTVMFFAGVSTKLAKQRVKSVICQINDMLASTDLRIINKRHYRPEGALYQLKEVTAEEMRARKWTA